MSGAATTVDVVEIIAAAAHRGPARHLVHRLKYHADWGAGDALARLMAPLAAEGWLVPVPRAAVRRIRYGIDPARWLARRIATMNGMAVADVLRPGLWWPRHAGSPMRRPPRFTLTGAAPSPATLIDDVATTGATLRAAADATGIGRALVATAAGPKDPGRFGPS
jgi:predicted amidophosphoribosyltransferase